MTEIKAEDGSTIVTDLPAEKVADLQPKEPETPATPAEGEKPPVEVKTEEAKTPEEPPKEPEAPKGPEEAKIAERQPKKPTPIQTLLEKKHEAEQRAEAAEAKLKELAEQPKSVETTADIKAFAEKYGLEEGFAADLVNAVKANVKPELPKEVLELLAETQARKQQETEMTAFNKRVDSLSVSLKDALLKQPEVREKLQALAYSTEKAPDGEPYFKKELAEIYFAYIKPEVEPAKPSVDEGRAGKGSVEVVDFQAIFDRDDPSEVEAMDDNTFKGYSKWLNEKGGDVPITRKLI